MLCCVVGIFGRRVRPLGPREHVPPNMFTSWVFVIYYYFSCISSSPAHPGARAIDHSVRWTIGRDIPQIAASVGDSVTFDFFSSHDVVEVPSGVSWPGQFICTRSSSGAPCLCVAQHVSQSAMPELGRATPHVAIRSTPDHHGATVVDTHDHHSRAPTTIVVDTLLLLP